MPLLINTSADSDALEARIQAALAARIASTSDYSEEEIAKVSKLNRRLFPRNFVLDQESTDIFRSLCALSRAELIAGTRIASHRKYIGTVIVFCKQILWKFVRANLDDTFKALQEYNSWLIYNQARQHVLLSQQLGAGSPEHRLLSQSQ